MDDDLFERYQKREEQTEAMAEEVLDELQRLDEEEENEDTLRGCWSNVCADVDRCKVLCGYIPTEFEALYEVSEEHIPENIGRGMRGKVSKKDKLLVVLCYVKHYETIAKMADTFSMSKSNLQRILSVTINAIMPILYDHFVVGIKEFLDEESEDEPDVFPNAKYVMDATVQPIWTPTGTFDEKKRYYSGKHKAYVLKSQCLHDRKGYVVHCVPGVLGAVHDLTVARQSLNDVSRSFLALTCQLKTFFIRNEDEDYDENNTWDVLVDSGYQGFQHVAPAILPYKKKSGRRLTQRQVRFNRSLASERVICERFYGRLKGRCRIMTSKYRNSREEYSTAFKLCVALTNFHLANHPL